MFDCQPGWRMDDWVGSADETFQRCARFDPRDACRPCLRQIHSISVSCCMNPNLFCQKHRPSTDDVSSWDELGRNVEHTSARAVRGKTRADTRAIPWASTEGRFFLNTRRNRRACMTHVPKSTNCMKEGSGDIGRRDMRPSLNSFQCGGFRSRLPILQSHV